MLGKEYTAYEIFEHFRNSVVHNNFRCENGIIYIRDCDENGVETARFVIPYEMVEELIEKQKRMIERAKEINPKFAILKKLLDNQE